MKLKYWVVFVIFFLFAHFNLLGQFLSYSDTISWSTPEKVFMSDIIVKNIINFPNGQFASPNSAVPHWVKRIALQSKANTLEARLIVYETTTLSAENARLLELDLQEIDSKFDLKSYIFKERTNPYLHFLLFPIRKNSSGNYELIKSFTIEYSLRDEKRTENQKSYAQNSVLRSGNWYRFAVRSTGIAQITFMDLKNMGIDPESISPSSISVYGNGGNVLPESNATFRYDDLQEVAIQIVGGEDGTFDENDYILFYSKGPIGWEYDSSLQMFKHIGNPYSDFAYYFISTDSFVGIQKRVSSKASLSQTASNSYNSFTDYSVYEKDAVNLVKSGKKWLGEIFDMNTSYNFPFRFNGFVPSSSAKLFVNLAAASSTTSTFNITVGGQSFNLGVTPISYNNKKAELAEAVYEFVPSVSTFNVGISYNKPNVISVGWLDYININVKRYLKQSDAQLSFRVPESVGVGNISEFVFTDLHENSVVWDVTDFINPIRVTTVPSANGFSFRDQSDSLREYVLFDGSSFLPIVKGSKIENQNLHALSNCDMLLVTYPNFINQANTLANFHREQRGLEVHVVDVSQIYNEFASGSPDPTAIRDFVKMFYTRHGASAPKFLLLFGDASYDYKNVLGYNQNFIPTYQNDNSVDEYSSWTTDDYFGLLDDNEGQQAIGSLDIGIGRFVVQSQDQASQMVNKTIRYLNPHRIAPNQATQISNFGDWRSYVSIIGDDEDNNVHITDANKLAKVIEDNFKAYNVEKIYFDAYPQVSFSGGQRYPDVEDAINQRLSKGALFVDYVGHGGEVGWAHERVLKITDIQQWTNTYNMPIFITATCEFTRFDDPSRTSAGELVFLNSNGGAVALLTTSRVAYSNTNYNLNNVFLSNAFVKTEGQYKSLGDLMQLAKNSNATSYFNIRNFILVGDPSIIPSYPKYNVVATHINGNLISTEADTIGAFSKVNISGAIMDDNGIVLENFNGLVYPTIFDKPSSITTLENDPRSYAFTFLYQKNVLFKGKVSVVNGRFNFDFIVPKDISYDYGNGKISFYAYSENEDALGYFDNFIIGGVDTLSMISDDKGPEIRLFMNDDKFVNAGMTNESPLLIAYVGDSTGINTVSNGVGHDAVAILNDDLANSIIINDFFESDLDSYNSGVFKYPFRKLPEGRHKLTVKVWDILNNSSQESIEFIVVNSAELAIKHVLNYPNPFTTHTSFFFEQNQPENILDIQIQIFTVSGKMVKNIRQSVSMNGFRSDAIEWDGRDDFGDKLAKGVYLYKLRVRNEKGEIAEKTEKIVII